VTSGSGGAGAEGLGARPQGDGRCRFTVWAPAASTVDVELGHDPVRVVRLDPVGDGYHRAEVGECPPGTRYRYVLDGVGRHPDPASRWQPDGVHGPSAVVDTGSHPWKDAGFVPPAPWRYVLYELHVGTFTASGTFDGAVPFLDELVDLGVTAVEPLPVAQFPGRRNWGYDGVLPFAVQDSYGGPAAFQRFVDACHQRGLAVVLDVVYNHLGPEGNIFGHFGPYFTDRYRTPWGEALNFDGAGSDQVRRYFIDNALGWFEEFHVDALRLDAVHGIVDPTAVPFLAQLGREVSDLGERLGRRCLLIAESADNNPRVISPEALGGLGLDAQWNDDFHHAVHAVLTGERTGYYRDFGQPQQVATAITDGFVYRGEFSAFRGRRHGAPTGDLDPWKFITFVQNHDQIGNRPRGDRLATTVDFDVLRLAAALLCLSPGVPLLFMGEEYGEQAPFPYFVDHGDPDLVEAVRTGRAHEFADGWDEAALDPADPETFTRAVLDRSLAAKGEHARLRSLYQQLLRLRREHPALARSARHQVSCSVVGDGLLLRRGQGPGSVCVLYNLNGHRPLEVPLPDSDLGWSVLLDSADRAVGGSGPTVPASAAGGSSAILPPSGFRILEELASSPSDPKDH
jgi:maltooligosyltrehalose trehalohydrolase